MTHCFVKHSTLHVTARNIRTQGLGMRVNTWLTGNMVESTLFVDQNLFIF